MRRKQKILSLVLSFLMMFSVFSMPGTSLKAQAKDGEEKKTNFKVLNQKDIDYQKIYAQKHISGTQDKVNPNENVRVIVQLSAPSTLEMAKQKGMTLNSALKMADAVKKQQQPLINKVKAFGQIRNTYQNTLNGFSAGIKYKDIDKIREMPGVKKVTIANKYLPDMNTATDITKVTKVWQESGYKGQGMVAAIIDTGIDYTHKDMKITDTGSEKLTREMINGLGGPGRFYTDKVPYGYNFADRNDDVTDRTSSMHGMHVAGIVGANGTDEEIAQNKAIKGAASEAQLLAMKVFSNNPEIEGAFSDDIAAAIDDSIKHNADVINMSLGSTAGFVQEDDPEYVAIENATEAGVIVVVSAGNSAYSTSPYLPYDQDPDVGTVGSPGLYPNTICVASIENDRITLPALDYEAGDKSGQIGYFTSEVNPLCNLIGDYEIVDCGLGYPEDFEGKDLNGKIALIKRGELDFVTKKLNAQYAGAAGVIVYNKDEDDTYISMATDPSIYIPAVFITNKDGETLKGLIDSGIRVSFKGKVIQVDNNLAGQMSDFSSWGSTPDLSFKPEVTAPGGNIYSTVNDNSYETMSGTSMAAPNTTGVMVLIAQHLKDKNLNKNLDFVKLAKNLLISTAKPQLDPNSGNGTLPYLTRLQGAGVINAENAVKSSAYVTDKDGNSTIALKEIKENSTEFKMIVNNLSDKELKFDVKDKYGVLTNANYADEDGNVYPYLTSGTAKLAGASLNFDKTEITVPANGSETVNVTLALPGDVTNVFAEGFITLESKTDKQPDLGIPYMGFYGDWAGQNSPRLFDAPVWDTDNTTYGLTALVSPLGDYLGQVGIDDYGMPIIDKDLISISEDEYADFTGVMPAFALLRNAKELKIQVLDKNKKVIRTIATEENVPKTVIGDNPNPYMNSDWAWDGKIYNPSTSNYEFAPEGQYYIRLAGKADYEGASESTLDMPVKIDNNAPEFDASLEKLTKPDAEGNNYRVNITNTHDNVDIIGFLVLDYALDIDRPLRVKAAQIPDSDIIGMTDAGRYSGKDVSINVKLPNTFLNGITVMGYDYAGNLAERLILNNNKVITFTKMPEDLVGGEYNNSILTDQRNIEIDYKINPLLSNFVDHVSVVLDKETPINNGKEESIELKELKDGRHNVDFKVYGDNDEKNLIGEDSVNFTVDTGDPVIDIKPQDENSITVDESGKKHYQLKFNVSDISGYTLYVDDGSEITFGVKDEPFDEVHFNSDEEAAAGKDYEITLNNPSGKIKAEDELGNETEIPYNFEDETDRVVLNITSPQDYESISSKVVHIEGNVKCSDMRDLKVVMTIDGDSVVTPSSSENNESNITTEASSVASSTPENNEGTTATEPAPENNGDNVANEPTPEKNGGNVAEEPVVENNGNNTAADSPTGNNETSSVTNPTSENNEGTTVAEPAPQSKEGNANSLTDQKQIITKSIDLNNDVDFAFKEDFDGYGPKNVRISVMRGDTELAAKEIHFNLSPMTFDQGRYYVVDTKVSHDITIPYTIDNEDGWLKSIQLTVDGADYPVQPKLEDNSITLTNLTGGKHNVEFNFFDEAGNNYYDTVTVDVDNHYPTVSNVVDDYGNTLKDSLIYKPANGIPNKFGSIQITGQVDQPVQYLKINNDYVDVNDDMSFTKEITLTEGLNLINFELQEAGGAENVNSYAYKVYYDGTTPLLTIKDKSDMDINDNSRIALPQDTDQYTLNITADDNTFGYKVFVNGDQIGVSQNEVGDGKNLKKTFEYVYDVPGGESTLNVAVQDIAGNRIENNIRFNRVITEDKLPSILPKFIEFDRNAPAEDKSINITLNGNKLLSIQNDKDILNPNGDYKLENKDGADILTISKDYLSTLPRGENILTLKFNSNTDIYLKVIVSDEKSDDASLDDIKINNNSVNAFKSDKYNYIVEMSGMDLDVSKLDIQGISSHNAKIEITKPESIPGTAEIKVTSEDGKVINVYKLNFIVPLQIEKISGGTSFKPGDTAKVTVRAINTGNSIKNAALVMALYNKNGEVIKLLDLTAGKHAIGVGQSVEMTGIINIPKNLDSNSVYTIKCFIWDSVDGMTPLSNAIEVPVVSGR